MKGQTYTILALVFALLVAIFAVINVEAVEVNYLFGTGNLPLILIILISVLMGGIITTAVGVVRLIRIQRENRSLKQQIKELKDKLEGSSAPTVEVIEEPISENGQDSD